MLKDEELLVARVLKECHTGWSANVDELYRDLCQDLDGIAPDEARRVIRGVLKMQDQDQEHMQYALDTELIRRLLDLVNSDSVLYEAQRVKLRRSLVHWFGACSKRCVKSHVVLRPEDEEIHHRFRTLVDAIETQCQFKMNDQVLDPYLFVYWKGEWKLLFSDGEQLKMSSLSGLEGWETGCLMEWERVTHKGKNVLRLSRILNEEDEEMRKDLQVLCEELDHE